MTQHKIHWTVGLSNGTTLWEEKGDYATIEGELSPWQRLLSFVAKENLKITSLSLFMGDRRWNLPSAGKNPKFKAFADAEQPEAYRFFRKIGADVIGGGQLKDPEVFTVAEAIYKDKKLQTWVSEENPDNSWSMIV